MTEFLQTFWELAWWIKVPVLLVLWFLLACIAQVFFHLMVRNRPDDEPWCH